MDSRMRRQRGTCTISSRGGDLPIDTSFGTSTNRSTCSRCMSSQPAMRATSDTPRSDIRNFSLAVIRSLGYGDRCRGTSSGSATRPPVPATWPRAHEPGIALCFVHRSIHTRSLAARPPSPTHSSQLASPTHIGQSGRVPDKVRTLDLGFVPNSGAPLPSCIAMKTAQRSRSTGSARSILANAFGL
jgi:hypothetical protein